MAAMQYTLPMASSVTEVGLNSPQIATIGDLSCVLDPFLKRESTFDVATEAYHTALKTLSSTLNTSELADVQATKSIKELHAIAEQVQILFSHPKRKGRVQGLVEILDHYSPVLDVLSQSHSEYTALLWGSMKWLLQRKLVKVYHDSCYMSAYCPQITCLESFRSFMQLLYNSSLKLSLFWKSRKIRKFVVAFWSPFEIKFGDTTDKISRLQECVEKDAIATEMAQRRRDSLRIEDQLRELSLVTRHTWQSILEVKKRQTVLLLTNVRQHLFASFDCKSEYQEECTRVYSTFISTEWEETRGKEAQISSWNWCSHSRVTYVQLECLEPAVGAGIVLHDRKYSPNVKRVNLFWGPSMTKESALATLIFGTLTQHPEKLLYREATGFYAEKFTCSCLSFDRLWAIFTEMMSVLPELCCTIHVASYDIDATEFITKLMRFATHSQHGRLDLLIYHTTVSTLSNYPGWIEMDTEYDVDFDLNSCDSFFRIVLLETGYYENLSATMQSYLWKTTWRSLRYNLMSLTFHQTCHIIRPDVRQHDGNRMLPSFQYESRLHQEASILLKRRIIAFLQLIPFEMSPETQEQLYAALNIPKLGEWASETLTENEKQITFTKAQPVFPNGEQRAEIWANVLTQFEAVISNLFEEKILNTLNHTTSTDDTLDLDLDAEAEIPGSAHIQQMDLVGRQVFCQDRWSAEDLALAQIKLEDVLTNAARTGLKLMQKVDYPL